ncbi:MAG: RelA/SpoT domain-containing protein, partial [Pseudomonadota bacterium]
MLSKEVFLKQFEGRFCQFLHLQRCIDGLIKDAFNREGVPHLYVQSRVKSADSAFQKVERKKYESPFEEMTDIVAVRIIVYLNSEVELAKQKITALFEVDDFKSTDKRQPRAADVVGYRSLHMICSLGLNR